MKLTALIVVVLAIAYGSTPVAAIYGPVTTVAPTVVNFLFNGIRDLLTYTLQTIFDTINNLLVLIFKKLLGLVKIFVPGDKLLPLRDLILQLLRLPKPNLISVLVALFQLLRIDGTLLLNLIPIKLANTPINVFDVINIAAPFFTGLNVTVSHFLNAIGIYLQRYYYALAFP